MIDQNLSILLGLAKVITSKDPSLQESFGLNRSTERTVASAAVLERPKDFRVSFDKKGHPEVSVTKIMSAKGYEVRTRGKRGDSVGPWSNPISLNP